MILGWDYLFDWKHCKREEKRSLLFAATTNTKITCMIRLISFTVLFGFGMHWSYYNKCAKDENYILSIAVHVFTHSTNQGKLHSLSSSSLLIGQLAAITVTLTFSVLLDAGVNPLFGDIWQFCCLPREVQLNTSLSTNDAPHFHLPLFLLAPITRPAPGPPNPRIPLLKTRPCHLFSSCN